MAAIIEFGFNGAAVSAGIDKLEQRLKGFEKIVGRASLGAGLATVSGVNAAAVTRLGAGMVQAAARLESYRAALQAVSKDTAPLTAQIERLRELAKQPGLNFEEAVQGSIRLQATGLSALQAEKTIKEMANALASVGGTAEQLDGVTLALAQIQAKGKVSAEEINQLAERLPQIRQLMKDAFGSADTEVLQKMGLSSQAFIGGIVDQASKAERAMAGTSTQIAQLLAQWEQLKATVGEPMAAALLPIMQRLVEMMPGLAMQMREAIGVAREYGDGVERVARLVAAWSVSLGALKLAQWVQGLLAKRTATQASAAAISQETAAVQANTAAQQANAAAAAAASAARGPGKVALHERRPAAPRFNEREVMGRLTDSGAAYDAGRQAGKRLVAGTLAGAAGLGSAAASLYRSQFIDPARDAGEYAASAMVDAMSVTLAMSGGPIGMAVAAAAQGAFTYLAKRRAEIAGAADAFDGNTSAIQRSDEQAKQLDITKAREILEQRIKVLKEQAAAATGIEAKAYEANVRELELELRLLPQKVEAYREAAAEALRLGDIEARNAQREKRALEQKAAMGRLQEIRRAVQDQQIDQAPLKQQVEYWGQSIKDSLGEALAQVNLDRLANGQAILRGWKLEIDSITQAMEALAKQGDFINAERLGKALKEAQAAADRLAAARKRENEVYDHLPTAQEAAKEVKEKAEKERQLNLAKEELALEQAILEARLRAGGQDSAEVQALEDRLNALRQMQQIEASGVAKGAEALALAERRVAAERAISEAAAKKQREEATANVAQEMAVLEAKAKGNVKLAQAMERQQAIQERARQIQEQTGVDPQQAMATATRMQQLQDAIRRREEKEAEEKERNADGKRKRRKIGGKPATPDGIDVRRGLSGRAFEALATHSPLSPGGGLKGFEDLQRGIIGSLGGVVGPSERGRGTWAKTKPEMYLLGAQHHPLKQQAAENAASAMATEAARGGVISVLTKLLETTQRGFFG